METIKESLLKDVKNSGKGGFFYRNLSSWENRTLTKCTAILLVHVYAIAIIVICLVKSLYLSSFYLKLGLIDKIHAKKQIPLPNRHFSCYFDRRVICFNFT